MGSLLWLMLLFPGVSVLPPSLPRQFHVVKEEKTWEQGQQYCREKYTDLATIDDMTEMKTLNRTIQNEGATHAWIGLRYGSSPKWQWSLADKDFYRENEAGFRRWHLENQPDGRPGEDCVMIGKEGSWFDYYCNSTHPFICYGERNSTHPNVLIEEEMTWADAQRYCRKHYTDLASVRNQTENYLIEAVRRGRDAWIGLFNDTFEWSDGSNSSFRHWGPGEPSDHQAELCVEVLSSSQWNDKPCDTHLKVICYEALPTVEVVSPQSPFYPGDTVTMRCHKPTDTNWRLYWLKDNSLVLGKTSQTITITVPKEAGQYQCYIKRDNSSVATYSSKPASITCNDLPVSTLEVLSPPGPHFSGDVVTLKCNVTPFTDWYEYAWLKDNSTVTGKTSQTINITLPQGSGLYQCYGQRQGRPDASSPSSSVGIMNEDKLILVNENKTWMEALQHCRRHHVDLVSVFSAEIQRWVEGWAKGASSPHVWLGLRYECSFGFWFWVSGHSVCYGNWAPDAEFGHCCETRVGAVERHGGKWCSLEEHEHLNFICTTKE